MSHHISTQYGQNAITGLLGEKKEVIPIAGDDLDFLNFRADRLTAVWVPSLSLGGRGRAAQFSFSSELRSSVFVYDSDMRQQVPKPMLAYAPEGELFAFTVNGDRYEA